MAQYRQLSISCCVRHGPISTALYCAFTPSLGDAIERPNDASEVAEHTLAAPTPPDGDFWHLHVDGAEKPSSLPAEKAPKRWIPSGKVRTRSAE
ncbi:hypothetical protein EV1_039967 [Malus domestica]